MKQENQRNKLLLEALVIVGSILLAFTIDAWWDGVQQRQSRQKLFSQIEAALIDNIELVSSYVENISRPLDRLNSFMEIDPSEIPEWSSADVKSLTRAMAIPVTSAFNNGTITSLFDTGNSIQLTDPQLIEAVAEWRTLADTLNRRREILTWHEREMMRALGQHAEIRPFIKNLSPSAIPPDKGATEALRAAIGDADIMSLATNKIGALGINRMHQENLVNQSEVLLGIIRSLDF